MATSEPKAGGIIESVRRVGHSLIALLQNRLQLFSVELQEEKYRAIQAVLWLAVGGMLIFLGLAMGVGALGILVYTKWGVGGLGALTALLLVAGAIVIAVLWGRLKSSETPFAGTIRELKKDSEWLQRKR
jgi:uncharacterized membrane protein YqjE